MLAKKGISEAWLLAISNIEFRLLSDEQIEDGGADVYFFKKPELKGQTYNLGFAFGDPECSYVGDWWRFRIANNRLRLWKAGGMGNVCGEGREFKIAGKLNSYPNELVGFEFFDKGKLKRLKLTVSTRDEVKNKFGFDCGSACQYDRNWVVPDPCNALYSMKRLESESLRSPD
ncbi:MAG: hypothetical protein WKF92_16580 [Pyrinomonadaceae bacterium]